MEEMKSSDQAEKTKKHFDSIASTYSDSSDGRFCESAYKPILQELGQYKLGKWLDVSCGTGTVLSILKDSPLEKYGVDFSEKMIEEARRNVGDDVRLYVASAEEMPFDKETFDVVTCSFAFHHYVRPAAVLRELRRIMKPEATLIIVDPYLPLPLRLLINPLLRFSNHGDYHMYGQRELERMMRVNDFIMEDFVRVGQRVFFSHNKAR